MSAAEAPDRPRMPNGRLYYSPRGLYPFQAEAVARAVVFGEQIVTLDRGLGKTHVAMRVAAEMIEEGTADIVMMIGKRPKVARKEEFPLDFATFTSLDTFVYHGPGREKRLAKHGVPEVFMTTYETGRAELMRYEAKAGARGKGSKVLGPLAEALGLKGKRVLWVFDEVAKLGNRSSELYKTYFFAVGALAKLAPQYKLGLTATPMSTDYEQPFNIGRVVMPGDMPSVGDFERVYTYGKDERGRYRSRSDQRDAFAALFQQKSFRKRQTDPDVAAQMPRLVTDFLVTEMDPAHARLYTAVKEIFSGGDPGFVPTPTQEGQLATALKLTAGHPASHLRSDSVVSKAISEAVGEDVLRSIPSSKTLQLIEELETLVTGQGAQVLVFTKYAETVLPEVAADLAKAGFLVRTYTGRQADAENSETVRRFKDGHVPIMLASDAAAEGLNLPEATYIVEYESAETWTTREQRFGRHTRIGSGKTLVFGLTQVLAGTVEVGVVEKALRRKYEADILVGDQGAEGHLPASALRRQLKEALPA